MFHLTLKRLALLLCFFVSGLYGVSEIKTPHATAKLVSPYTQVKPGDTLQIGFSLTPDKGWHTYWKNPGDSGLPVRLRWALPPEFVATPLEWPTPERFFLDPLVNYGYHSETIFLTDIKLPETLSPSEKIVLSVTANWLVCEESCIPESAVLTLPIVLGTQTVLADEAWLLQAKEHLPTPYPHALKVERLTDTQLRFVADYPHPELIKDVQFFPEASVPLNAFIPSKLKKLPHGFSLSIELTSVVSGPVAGVLKIYFKEGAPLAYVVSSSAVAAQQQPLMQHLVKGLVFMMIFAFLGGLILNVMPCVFPILSLKILSLLSHADEGPKKLRSHAIFYASGVLTGLLGFFFLISVLKSGGMALGWGFHLQSPLFVGILIYLMAYIGFYLLGVAPLPLIFYTLSGKAGSVAGQTSFLTGLLAVAVATPCTAPFMAVAIGAAFSQPFWVGFLIFVSLSIGFSSPFLLLGIFPSLAKSFPKPGVWMEILKEIMAFPMFLTVLWLLWVLSMQVGFSGVLAVLLGIVLIGFGCWLSRRASRVSLWGWCLVIVVLGASLSVFHKQPYSSSELFLQTPQTIEELRASGKRVFVDVTASWCITCQVNKKRVLQSTQIKRLFEEYDITLVTLDWTNQDESITHYLESFGRSGVPLYVYYAPNAEPVVLPQLLSNAQLKSMIETDKLEKETIK